MRRAALVAAAFLALGACASLRSPPGPPTHADVHGTVLVRVGPTSAPDFCAEAWRRCGRPQEVIVREDFAAAGGERLVRLVAHELGHVAIDERHFPEDPSALLYPHPLGWVPPAPSPVETALVRMTWRTFRVRVLDPRLRPATVRAVAIWNGVERGRAAQGRPLFVLAP